VTEKKHVKLQSRGPMSWRRTLINTYASPTT